MGINHMEKKSVVLVLDYKKETKELFLKSGKETFSIGWHYDDEMDGDWGYIYNEEGKKIGSVFFSFEESISQFAKKIANRLDVTVELSENAKRENEKRKEFINSWKKEGHKIDFEEG